MNNRLTVYLFSTRFIEKDDKLFSTNNIETFYCLSDDYKKFFLENLSQESILVFNKLCYLKFFRELCINKELCDDLGNTLITFDDSINTIKEKLAYKYKLKNGQSIKEKSADMSTDRRFKRKWSSFFTALQENSRLYSINIIPESEEDIPFEIKTREKSSFEILFQEVLDSVNVGTNAQVILNTDFRETAPEKRTIDRRFKIYKLKTEKESNVLAYAIWCLRDPCSNPVDWYRVLYEEIKCQLGEEIFKQVGEINLILHDGDIEPHTTFEVREYGKTRADFESSGFVIDDQVKLNVCLFQHSLDPIADALSKNDIIAGLDDTHKAIMYGGELGILHGLSDCIAKWHEIKEQERFQILKEKLKNFLMNYKDGRWAERYSFLDEMDESMPPISELNTKINEQIAAILDPIEGAGSQ